MTSIPENLINLASKSPNVKAAVVCADQKSILNAINESIKLNLINPILIGKKITYIKFQKKSILIFLKLKSLILNQKLIVQKLVVS